MMRKKTRRNPIIMQGPTKWVKTTRTNKVTKKPIETKRLVKVVEKK